MTNEIDLATGTVARNQQRHVWAYIALALMALAMVIAVAALAMRTSPGPQGRASHAGASAPQGASVAASYR